MRSELRLLGMVAALSTPGCGFVVTGDEALADEFARFKAAGGQCTAAPPPSTDGALGEATRFSSLIYGAVLAEVVAPSGRVRYAALLEDVEARAALAAAVQQVGEVDPRKLSSRGAKLAYWVNAYNVLTLSAAAHAFEADPAFRVDQNGFAFFDRREHRAGGRTLSLNEIENGILRGVRAHSSTAGLPEEEWAALQALHDDVWGGEPVDPRFHFILNCASTSCPSLMPFAFRGDDVDDQMEEATRAFLHDDARGAGPDGISEIFAFYAEDFDAAGGIAAFIGRYRDTAGVDLGRFLAYDWSLNVADD